MKKIIIIGGVAGGMSAATRLRRLMEDAEIIVLEKGPFVSFANCGLPYYVSGEIAERQSLLVQTPEKLQARFNLDVRPFNEAIHIDPEKKIVTIKNQEKTYTESYDSLILSPGAKPMIPPTEGLQEAKNVFTLRNIPDLDKIMAEINQVKPTSATVIGAGFIGLEMAENLAKKGIKVIVIEKAPQLLPPLDEEMAAFVEREMEKHGVTLYTANSVVAFKENGYRLVLEDGQELQTDLVILAVGVTPENSLAQEAGVETGIRGGLLVDEHYETNLKDIYAVGDAIIVKQQITGEETMIPLASPANRQGRQVADVIGGQSSRNQGSIGTAIVRVFDLSAASTGLNERQVLAAGLPYKVVHTLGKDHAGYYPGATDIHLKLIFHPETGKIYGAQAIGIKGIDKRIDVLATAIKAGMTVRDLVELELTYAPPFGSAKDPVNMLGYVASNLMDGLSESIQWYELNKAREDGAVLIDVRTTEELLNGGFKDALSIPLDELREHLHELDKKQSYIVSCQSGLRSYLAERIMKQHGFNVKNLDGAFALYQTVKPEEIDYVPIN